MYTIRYIHYIGTDRLMHVCVTPLGKQAKVVHSVARTNIGTSRVCLCMRAYTYRRVNVCACVHVYAYIRARTFYGLDDRFFLIIVSVIVFAHRKVTRSLPPYPVIMCGIKSFFNPRKPNKKTQNKLQCAYVSP